ncbi:hypothetical protein BV22DRAFT_287475 [Leucogyrophana mollusca]|uniref:Uncharacterized protein n=1 Tax=Leucogyrophana mollusca TaxID=85980 RepID=A0ACB8BNP6_9AGAM|nr:hypothetical protein BV22DRAFT_287475 [Leucogyrophana mollusca]
MTPRDFSSSRLFRIRVRVVHASCWADSIWILSWDRSMLFIIRLFRKMARTSIPGRDDPLARGNVIYLLLSISTLHRTAHWVLLSPSASSFGPSIEGTPRVMPIMYRQERRMRLSLFICCLEQIWWLQHRPGDPIATSGSSSPLCSVDVGAADGSVDHARQRALHQGSTQPLDQTHTNPSLSESAAKLNSWD